MKSDKRNVDRKHPVSRYMSTLSIDIETTGYTNFVYLN